jgi:hypothetical protein
MEELTMSLQKYARKGQAELRDTSVGARIERSLYDEWISLCGRLGLKSSEALRYMIIEEINKDKVITTKQKEITKLPVENLIPTNVEQSTNEELSNVNVSISSDNHDITNDSPKKKKKRSSARSMLKWTVNDQLPCPLCNPQKWFTRTNYARHVKKHGYNSGYEMIQANLEVVEQMVKEKHEQ